MNRSCSNFAQDSFDCSTLFLLLGDVNYPIKKFSLIVTWSPIRHHELTNQGIHNYLFGDFSPEKKKGAILDKEMYEKLDGCLFSESDSNISLKWAPLAAGVIKWRLSRYQWLKQCLRAIIMRFYPRRIIISSDEDADIIDAVKAVAIDFNIYIEVQHGCYDQLTIFFGAYCLPHTVDPVWFHVIRWRIRCFMKKAPKVFFQVSHNVPPSFISHDAYPFYFNKSISLLSVLFRSIKRTLCAPFPPSPAIEPLTLNKNVPMLISHVSWVCFPYDELRLINAMLHSFFSHYSVDLCAKRLSDLFRISKPIRIILDSDQLDSNRLVIFIAHQFNIRVDYLPHGLTTEDYSGKYSSSLFQPDNVLAWNENSRQSFIDLGWHTIGVRHPAIGREVMSLRKLPTDVRTWKILLLVMPSWPTTQSDREDCWIIDTMSQYNALIEMGADGKNIHIKYRYSGNYHFEKINREAFNGLKRNCGMNFQIINSQLSPMKLFKNYDLIISGPTTGIIEAVFAGAPLIIYNGGLDRIGLLRDYLLPHASTAEELKTVLQQYNYDEVAKKYIQLAHSLQSGFSIL